MAPNFPRYGLEPFAATSESVCFSAASLVDCLAQLLDVCQPYSLQNGISVHLYFSYFVISNFLMIVRISSFFLSFYFEITLDF